MKFTATAKAFADAMSMASRLVETRNTYPILANVVIAVSDTDVTIRSTDLDVEITLPIEGATLMEPGKTTVPGRTLNDIVRKFAKDGEVRFEAASADTAMVSSGRSRFQLACLSPDSFPDLKAGAYRTTLEIPGADFARVLGQVAFAISNEETRYYLNGVYMHAISNEQVRFVATDGHRMARATYDLVGAQGMPGIIIPKKTVKELQALAERAETIKLEIGDTKIRATVGDIVLVSKLIEGTFPDYERVTPKNSNYVATVDVKAVMGAVDRVSTIASDRGGKAVKLTFVSNELKLEVTNPDHGTASEELEVTFEPDAAVDIGFNARYLADCLSIFGKGEVLVKMTDGGAPAVLVHPDNEDLFVVLMPMRV